MKHAVRVLASILFVPVLFCVWYAIAANYDYEALAGTYTFHSEEDLCVLVLKADVSFAQQRTQDGVTQHAGD